jgi:hypothetical protein
MSNRWASALLAFAIYQAAAIGMFGLPVFSDFSHTYIGIAGSADPAGYMWFLTWWPYALAHGINPFITKLVWAPEGFNVTWAHCVPLPAILAAPITAVWGPIASWNILCLAAPALAAWCAFILCRYLSGAFLPSLIGGCLFGFSPYMLGHLLGHLSLILIFPVPLALYLIVLRLDGRISRVAFVALFALVAIVQFLCCHEVLATTVILGGLVMCAALLTMGRDFRGRLVEICALAAIGLALAAIPLVPFLYYAFAHGFPRGPINPPEAYSSSLLAFLFPSPLLLISRPSLLTSVANRPYGSFAEDTAYVGIPLLLLIAGFGWASWRKPQARLAIVALVIIALASLGPRLHVMGATTVRMPWAAMVRLPIIDKALPGRFMMFAFLDIALIAAVYLATPPRRPWKWVLAVLSILSLAPNLPAGWWFSKAHTPRFFAEGAFRRHLERGEVTLLLPYGLRGNSMLWQARTGMYFRMAGGFLGLTPPAFLRWPVLNSLYSGEPCFDFARQLEFFLAAHRVRTIVVAQDARRNWPRLLAPLGIVPHAVDDVLLYPIPPLMIKAYGGVSAHQAATKVNRAAFAAMVTAADKYLARGLPPNKLTPWEAARLDILPLPPSDSGPVPGAPQWWQDLWLGTFGDSTIGIGVSGDYADIRSLIDNYGPTASTVFFPFPKKFRGPPSADTAGQLLMTFDHAGLERAAAQAGTIETR